jgi:AraC-like DNA-binding protein
MNQIPLVRARYIHPFATVLGNIGVPTERLLDRRGLSRRVLEDGETILPAHQVWAFIGSAALEQGIHDFGLQAGRLSIDAYGEFSRRLLQAANLNQGLEAFCKLARHEYSRADFYVARRRGTVWFCRGPIEGQEAERKHVELLVLTMMIATVRLVAGPTWRPRELYLQTKDPRGVDGRESLASSKVQFGHCITAFDVPTYLLARRMPSVAAPADLPDYQQLEYDVLAALRQLIAAWPAEDKLSVETVAEHVGISLRTFQRRLTEAGTSFSTLVTDVRMNRAVNLLRDRSMKLCDIAWHLGYADQANFTRAFRRWAGVPPQDYRRDWAAGR